MTTALPPLTRPRRWTVEVDGIRWIPRMADKARMSAYGTLGAYLMGHSPVDKALLRRLGLTTEEFTQIVAANPDDTSLLAALRAHGFDEDRVRRWSANFTTTYAAYIPLWDIDEGYRKPSPLLVPLVAFMKVAEGPVMALFRRISPAP
jgi:hypothetical protein